MTATAPLRLILADDHALFRQGLKTMLRRRPEVAVVAEVERLADVGRVLAETPCDMLLLDLQMERNALADIDRLARKVRVIVVTASEHPSNAVAALQAGASAVVFKRFAIETLIDAIRAVRDGYVWMPPSIQTEVRAKVFTKNTEALSRREREIVRLVALGLRNHEIAERLAIGEATVKTHLNKVFQKLAVRDRVDLARYAIRVGLIGVDESLS
jgi:two-component system NarL family response regulator